MYLQNKLKTLFLIIGVILTYIRVSAQQVYPPFVFSQIPQDFQLYARNENNIGTIPIVGIIQDKGWKTVSVLVYRDSKLFGYNKVKVQVNLQEDSFSANPTIKSEKSEYSISIYASKNDKDSVLVTSRKNIVAGDFYVIYGDSNGNTQNVIDYYPTNKYIRTFGRYNQDVQKDYLPKDTSWSVNENYFIPRVGAWGTMLQELIVEKYNIPVCIITGGGPGMYLDLLMDRQEMGLTSGGVYNSFGYRIKKSGLINDIKGFFFWHGVYELFSKTNPVEYDVKLKKIMGYFQKDFPNVQQYIVFQSGIVRFGLNENAGSSIRESQRSLAHLFPKVIPYAVEGLPGYEGVHYTKQGYANCASEMLNIIEPIFYAKFSNSNTLSPNPQKVFYTDNSHQSIKMVFQENQLIVLGNDTIIRSNGQNMTLSLKNNFFQDENFSKNIDIQEIISNKNTVILSTRVGYKAKKLSYLPSFHGAYAEDFPVFLGPYIKNNLQKRGMAFNAIKIQEPLLKPANLTANAMTGQIKLNWNLPQFPANAQVLIERKSGTENTYQVIKSYKSNITEFTDVALSSLTSYSYQLKVVSDSSESVYSQITLNTLESLAKPELSLTILYNNKIQLSWGTVIGAEKYLILKRLKNSNQYSELLNLGNGTMKTLIDSTLQPNQSYIYKIVTSRSPIEMSSDSIEVSTPALLTRPELSSTILFYNSSKISWKPVVGTISYQLERKTGIETYIKVATLDNRISEFIDRDLKENTSYTYRLKAFGDKTESLGSEISVLTLVVLATPELVQDYINYESVKLKWKAITSANKYILERQAQGETTSQKIFETDNLLEFVDLKLKENTVYSYRLKVTNAFSESQYAKIDIKTLAILSINLEESNLFKLFPNPTNEKLIILLSERISGNVSFIDLAGKTVFEQDLLNQKLVEINVSNFKKGIYLVLIKTNQELYSQKVIIE